MTLSTSSPFFKSWPPEAAAVAVDAGQAAEPAAAQASDTAGHGVPPRLQAPPSAPWAELAGTTDPTPGDLASAERGTEGEVCLLLQRK